MDFHYTPFNVEETEVLLWMLQFDLPCCRIAMSGA